MSETGKIVWSFSDHATAQREIRYKIIDRTTEFGNLATYFDPVYPEEIKYGVNTYGGSYVTLLDPGPFFVYVDAKDIRNKVTFILENPESKEKPKLVVNFPSVFAALAKEDKETVRKNIQNRLVPFVTVRFCDLIPPEHHYVFDRFFDLQEEILCAPSNILTVRVLISHELKKLEGEQEKIDNAINQAIERFQESGKLDTVIIEVRTKYFTGPKFTVEELIATMDEDGKSCISRLMYARQLSFQKWTFMGVTDKLSPTVGVDELLKEFEETVLDSLASGQS